MRLSIDNLIINNFIQMKGESLTKRPNKAHKKIQPQQSFYHTIQTNTYRRRSLPLSEVAAAAGKSLPLRKSFEAPSTEIYFDSNKKSKFVKGIVDGYFNEDIKEHLHQNKGHRLANEREVETISRNIKGLLRRKKLQAIEADKKLTFQHSPPKKQQHSQKIFSQSLTFPRPDELEVQPKSNSAHNFGGVLPPINETHDESEEFGKDFPEFAHVSAEIPIKDQSDTKVLAFQNEGFRILVHLLDGKPICRLKQYKPMGFELLRRQERARKMGVLGIWEHSKQNANTLSSQIAHPIKNSICRIIPSIEGPCKYKIRSSPFRKYLLSNDCLELKHLIRQICNTLKKVQGKVLNNKVNPTNIFILRGNQIRIGEWGCSSFREQVDIQQNKFQSRVNPILRSQNQWLATPEYLSPQILMAIMAQCEEQEPDIWENQSSSDIWSLGMTLFQILTMIPVWVHDSCLLKLKKKKPQGRSGVLGSETRNPERIIALQRKLSKNVRRYFEQEIQEEIPHQILALIEQMLSFDPSQRISIQQILQIIN